MRFPGRISDSRPHTHTAQHSFLCTSTQTFGWEFSLRLCRPHTPVCFFRQLHLFPCHETRVWAEYCRELLPVRTNEIETFPNATQHGKQQWRKNRPTDRLHSHTHTRHQQQQMTFMIPRKYHQYFPPHLAIFARGAITSHVGCFPPAFNTRSPRGLNTSTTAIPLGFAGRGQKTATGISEIHTLTRNRWVCTGRRIRVGLLKLVGE